ncbi:hypothetical protein [Nostoc sp.]|uniref:hypothetical protein n=1 Tax=Nostoc sp. TaxID=1180 RepID=UPI002FF61A03
MFLDFLLPSFGTNFADSTAKDGIGVAISSTWAIAIRKFILSTDETSNYFLGYPIARFLSISYQSNKSVCDRIE